MAAYKARRGSHHTSSYRENRYIDSNDSNNGNYDRDYNSGNRMGPNDNRRYGFDDNDYPGRYGRGGRSSGHDYERDFNPSTYGNRGTSYRGGSYEGGYGNHGYSGAQRGRSPDDYSRGDYSRSIRNEQLFSYGGTMRERGHDRDREGRWTDTDRYAGFQNPYESSTRVAEGQHRGKGPKGYKRSDERILEDVNDRLADDPYVDAHEIEISIQNGDVTLAGTIDDRYAKRRAEDIVESVSGVRNVENRLRVHHDEEQANLY